MRCLLDTHTFLWSVMDVPQLTASVRTILEDISNDIFLSAASAWEIAIKARLGHLDLPSEPSLLVPEQMVAKGFSGLAIEIGHALRAGSLPLLHRDPFDRLLVAQAQLEELTILTADPLILRYDVATHW